MTLKQKMFIAGMTVLALKFAIGVKADDKKITLQPVPSIDLNRYVGKWYEIAHLPSKFDESCEANAATTYYLREDGKLGILNECRKNNGDLKVVKGTARTAEKNGPNSKLEVRFAPTIFSFLPFYKGDYWIIELDPEYQYAVVGEPKREYLWILSRSPKMDDGTYQQLLQKVAAHGYDTSKIVRVKQTG